MRVVCVDTHILSWGVRKEASPAQEPMIERTELFLAQLDRDGIKILVPTVVLGEYLTRIPPENHAAVIDVFTNRFIVAPYDSLAASQAARIFQAYLAAKKSNAGSGSTAVPDDPRHVIWADCQILAIAVTTQCEALYTHDPGLTILAAQSIPTRELPRVLSN